MNSVLALILGFPVLILSVRGLFASRERLDALSSQIGTKNPVVARLVCAIGVLLFGALTVGGGAVSVRNLWYAMKSEQSEVQEIVSDGLRAKAGRVPDKVSLTKQADGSYKGSAFLGAEEWNVRVTSVMNQQKKAWSWEAIPKQSDEALEAGKMLKAGNVAGAIALFRKAIQTKPDYFEGHYDLAIALLKSGDRPAALVEIREAVRLNSKDADAHYMLASVLDDSGEHAEAIEEYRAALRLKPELTEAHHDLGVSLASSGDVFGAIVEFREAVRLDPNRADSQQGLANSLAKAGDKENSAKARVQQGLALEKVGEKTKANAAFRLAVETNPEFAEAHYHLAKNLADTGDSKGAISEYARAIELDPKLTEAQLALGKALADIDDFAGATAAYRQAVQSKPDSAESRYFLGEVLSRQGLYSEAIEALRTAHRLGSSRPDWPYKSEDLLKDAERKAGLAVRLPEFRFENDPPKKPTEFEKKYGRLKGSTPFGNSRQQEKAVEALAFAEVASEVGRFMTAARLYSAALKADGMSIHLSFDPVPHRYKAACAALSAASGLDKTEREPDDATRASLRGQALEWLTYELKNPNKREDHSPFSGSIDHLPLPSIDQQTKDRISSERTAEFNKRFAKILRRWQTTSLLASVRELPSLQALPQAEQESWREFWKAVATTLESVSKP